jgi:hypothetical protein
VWETASGDHRVDRLVAAARTVCVNTLLPLLVTACSPAFIKALPAAAEGYVPVPTRAVSRETAARPPSLPLPHLS